MSGMRNSILDMCVRKGSGTVKREYIEKTLEIANLRQQLLHLQIRCICFALLPFLSNSDVVI